MQHSLACSAEALLGPLEPRVQIRTSSPVHRRAISLPPAAAAIPQTRPPQPPQKHSTTSPAPQSAKTPQNHTSSASIRATPSLPHPTQSPPANYSQPPYNSSPPPHPTRPTNTQPPSTPP